MSGGSILALIGGLIALIAPLVLPFITVDEEEMVLHSFQVSTGLASIAFAVATIGLAAWIYKSRKQQAGWGISAFSLIQIAAMAYTYSNVWALVPAKAMGMMMADPGTGGLIEGTLITLDWGVALVVIGSVLSFFGGLLVVASHREFKKDERFLRLIVTWDNHMVYERVMFQPGPVTVGESDNALLQLSAGGMSSHVLFTPAGPEKYKIDVPKSIGGTVSIGGKQQDAAGTSAEVQKGDAGVLKFDNDVAVAWQFTGAEAGALTAALGREPGLAVSFATTSALTLLLLLGMMAGARGRHRAEAEEDLEKKGKELIEVSIEETEQKTDEIKPEGDEDEKTAKKAGGEEGKFGDPDKDPNKASKIPKMDGKMTDKIDVKNLGIAKVLGGIQAQNGALGQIMAGDTGALNSKMAVAMNGDGSELTIGGGAGGMGFRGTGSGGGGDGLGRIHGMGDIDTGAGTGRNANIGIGKKTAKKVAKINIASGQSTGGCDKGDIAKNVRARAATLRACYETQLLAKPDLAGKITVQWTITTDGSVTGEKTVDDSMHNNSVSDCVLRSMKRIRFMKPEAGICVIQWPFVFSPG
jgi:hypothetical protein